LLSFIKESGQKGLMRKAEEIILRNPPRTELAPKIISFPVRASERKLFWMDAPPTASSATWTPLPPVIRRTYTSKSWVR
jgi:hypothetical protein